jgi:hypothetical protein
MQTPLYNGCRAVHRDHGIGTVLSCEDLDYAYFKADKDGNTYFVYKQYLNIQENKNESTSRLTEKS